jgi:hypothetical protein
MSSIHPKADIRQCKWDVRRVPIGDIRVSRLRRLGSGGALVNIFLLSFVTPTSSALERPERVLENG